MPSRACRKSARRRCREEFEARFSDRVMAKYYLDVYQRCFAGRVPVCVDNDKISKSTSSSTPSRVANQIALVASAYGCGRLKVVAAEASSLTRILRERLCPLAPPCGVLIAGGRQGLCLPAPLIPGREHRALYLPLAAADVFHR
jgi:hypothetical protein